MNRELPIGVPEIVPKLFPLPGFFSVWLIPGDVPMVSR